MSAVVVGTDSVPPKPFDLENPKMHSDASPETFIRRADMQSVTGFEITTIYRMIKRGEFPAPVKLGARRVAWASSAIAAWQRSRIERQAA